MKRLELLIVQFDEAKRLIEIDRDPQLRLALIVLDSAVELVLHRMVQAEYSQADNAARWLPVFRQIESNGGGDDYVRNRIQELESEAISKTKRKKIDAHFAVKIELLTERGRLPVELGPVLNKLHQYRNETYHRDQHRIEVLRPAALVYFDAACAVLACYRPPVLQQVEPGPELGRFMPETKHSGFDLPKLAADQLRSEIGLDLDAIRSALRDYLLGRLNEAEDGLAFIEGNMPDVAPGDGLRLVQAKPEDTLAEIRSSTYPHVPADLVTWRQRASAMDGIVDRHELMTEFAAIEDEFEELEAKISDLASELEADLQLQLDVYRGK